MTLCFNQTERMSNFLCELLYVIRITELLFVVHNDSMFDFWNRHLNEWHQIAICSGIYFICYFSPPLICAGF